MIRWCIVKPYKITLNTFVLSLRHFVRTNYTARWINVTFFKTPSNTLAMLYQALAYVLILIRFKPSKTGQFQIISLSFAHSLVCLDIIVVLSKIMPQLLNPLRIYSRKIFHTHGIKNAM